MTEGKQYVFEERPWLGYTVFRALAAICLLMAVFLVGAALLGFNVDPIITPRKRVASLDDEHMILPTTCGAVALACGVVAFVGGRRRRVRVRVTSDAVEIETRSGEVTLPLKRAQLAFSSPDSLGWRSLANAAALVGQEHLLSPEARDAWTATIWSAGRKLKLELSQFRDPERLLQTLKEAAGPPFDYATSTLWKADRNDCGPVALALVAQYYGVDIDLGTARARCGTTPEDGTNVLQLSNAAEGLGFKVKAARADDYGVLLRLPFPLIAHVRVDLTDFEHQAFGLEPFVSLNQFVVVFRATAQSVDLVETAIGRHQMSPGDFDKIWTRKVLLVVPTELRVS